MAFLDLVKKRGSCRRYLNKPIPREVIERCLEAARLAPSACNSQPWYFIVVDNEEIKNEIVQRAFCGIYSMNSFVKEAPCLVVVVRERSAYAARLAGCLRGIQYSLIDIGIACEHFILKAEEEGLGSCWIGWFNEGAVKKILNLPRNKKIDIIISVGFPEDTDIPAKNRKTISEISEFR